MPACRPLCLGSETVACGAQTLAERIQGADLVVTSYALFRIDYEAYAVLPWSGLILDKAQFVRTTSQRPTGAHAGCRRRSSWPSPALRWRTL